MRYYIIVGEASGDLHASNLMLALKSLDSEADFRYYGGDLMQAVGGTLVKHYKELAYMGFIPVLTHLGTIMRNMQQCKADIEAWRPDALILVDYPGFNLNIAKYILSLAATVDGKVDVILLTGGAAASDEICDAIARRVGFVAPVKRYPGEHELASLAENGYNILSGKVQVRHYDKNGAYC